MGDAEAEGREPAPEASRNREIDEVKSDYGAGMGGSGAGVRGRMRMSQTRKTAITRIAVTERTLLMEMTLASAGLSPFRMLLGASCATSTRMRMACAAYARTQPTAPHHAQRRAEAHSSAQGNWMAANATKPKAFQWAAAETGGVRVNFPTQRATAAPKATTAQKIKPWWMAERLDHQWMKPRSRVMRME